MNAAAEREIERLERLGARAPGSPAFATLAEAHRRAGDAAEALRIAERGLTEDPDHASGRVALALALLDLGRADDARLALERVLGEVPDHVLALRAQARLAEPPASLDDVAEVELEHAFEHAEAQSDEMWTANHVAEAAIEAVEADEEDDPLAAEDGPFATETVAHLLERQGHDARAREIRQGLVRRGSAPPAPDRERVIATLERWLENLRRSA
jgi:predicted Zn-dependent protease